MDSNELTAGIIFSIGPLDVTSTVITTWLLMIGLFVVSYLSTRRLEIEASSKQAAIEAVVISIEQAIKEMAPQHSRQILPFIGSLWVFLVIANLTGLVPGLESPTRDLSATAALAILVFLSVHWFGIHALGLKSYLRHYLVPSPILLPFHIISEFTRTIALAIRLFGNIMSLEMTALLVLLVAGFLAPIPILLLHIVEALVQAYIFGILALTYISGALQTQQLQHSKKE